ncbi:inositol monophosphatase [Acrocarpospora corrugata]|uniref:Inositol-1-monophosphatase n=2 Tax=Acrocarpospora corrugata TaxID=35763 RepID=A0A5M3WE10_9ACTN|nr:inositol monophosphatase [Acrocarpospora corrugata]
MAVQIAHDAGRLLRGYALSGPATIDYPDGVEPVTKADLAADRLIGNALVSAFPRHRVQSEESGPIDGYDGPVWIVDPLDGTANFARGHRYVAVSLAYAVDGVVEAAVVHAPFLDETFTATRGGGAALNGTAIKVSVPESLRRAIVSTGFPHRRGEVDALVERVRRLLVSCQDIRRAAAPALDICWVAAGRLDAHTEDLRPWDVAAAGLVATEAGASRGHLPSLPGNPPESGARHACAVPPELCGEGFLVAAPSIYEELVSVLSG